MLDRTLDAFAEGGNSVVAPQEALPLIEGWLQALQGDPNVDAIKQSLTELSEQLQSAQPDGHRISTLLTDMAAQAANIAQGPYAEGTWTGKLERMSKILDEFGHNL